MPYKDKEKQKKYIKLWQKNNIEYLKKYRKKWRENNPEYREKIILRNNQWCKDNPEYHKQYYQNNEEKIKKYREENKEKILKLIRNWKKTEKGKAYRQRNKIERRSKMMVIINTLTSEEWLSILKKFKYKCVYCKKEFDLFNLPTRDHIIPISKGGDNKKENIVPACRSCNSKKHNKILGGLRNE